MTTVKAECRSCKGTGLYSGMCEGEGKAVVCLGCKGTGCELISYRPYVGRKKRNGIQTISYSRGSFIGSGVSAYGESMTYKEFLDNVPEALQ